MTTSRTERDLAIAELDGEVALDHDEKLVFIFVLMPDELTLNLGQFDLAVVQIRHDFRIPLIVKATEFLGQVDLVNSCIHLRCIRGRVAEVTSMRKLRLGGAPAGPVEFVSRLCL